MTEARTSPGALDAMRARRSYSKVGDAAPSDAELAEFIAIAGRVADHASLRPWRLITLRGDDRERLGAALGAADGAEQPSTKPLRAPLLIAVVASYQKSDKVPHWEQEAVAAGVAHALSLLLDEAGWGVIWRTGGLTRHPIVHEAHGLGESEALMGWLYVGSRPECETSKPAKQLDVASVMSPMPRDGVPNPFPAGKISPKKLKKMRKKAKKHLKRAGKLMRRVAEAEGA